MIFQENHNCKSKKKGKKKKKRKNKLERESRYTSYVEKARQKACSAGQSILKMNIEKKIIQYFINLIKF